MRAGSDHTSVLVATQRIVGVGAALAMFFGLALVTAAPLVPTDVLSPAPQRAAEPAFTELAPLPAVVTLRDATDAAVVTAIGRGWARGVAAWTASYGAVAQTRIEAPVVNVGAPAPIPTTPVIVPSEAEIGDLEVLGSPPVITYRRALAMYNEPDSRFQLTIDPARKTVVVTVADLPDVVFEIDYRDGSTDTHRIGVTPVLLGYRLEGNFERRLGELTFPLVTPTFDAGKVTYTTVSNEDDTLIVRFDGGPYARLNPDREAEGDTYLEVRFDVTEKRVRMDLTGLYYVRPAVGAEMLFASSDDEVSMTVDADTAQLLTYFEEPERVSIEDPSYGSYRLRTDVTRLQVQWDGVGTAFELDFDHAFKDRGQASVATRLVFPMPGQA